MKSRTATAVPHDPICKWANSKKHPIDYDELGCDECTIIERVRVAIANSIADIKPVPCPAEDNCVACSEIEQAIRISLWGQG